MTEPSVSNSLPAVLPVRPMHLVPPGELVSVDWEPVDRPGEGAALLPRSAAQLQVVLAVLPDPAGGVWARAVARGEIDIATAEPLYAASLSVVAAAAAEPRCGRAMTLVLDWDGISFLDCSALRLLWDISTAGVEQGWSLRWIPPSAAGPARFLRLAAEREWFPGALVARQLDGTTGPPV